MLGGIKGGYDVRGVAKEKSFEDPDKEAWVSEGVDPFTVDALPKISKHQFMTTLNNVR